MIQRIGYPRLVTPPAKGCGFDPDDERKDAATLIVGGRLPAEQGKR
jgi:hypothetical protein